MGRFINLFLTWCDVMCLMLDKGCTYYIMPYHGTWLGIASGRFTYCPHFSVLLLAPESAPWLASWRASSYWTFCFELWWKNIHIKRSCPGVSVSFVLGGAPLKWLQNSTPKCPTNPVSIPWEIWFHTTTWLYEIYLLPISWHLTATARSRWRVFEALCSQHWRGGHGLKHGGAEIWDVHQKIR